MLPQLASARLIGSLGQIWVQMCASARRRGRPEVARRRSSEHSIINGIRPADYAAEMLSLSLCDKFSPAGSVSEFRKLARFGKRMGLRDSLSAQAGVLRGLSRVSTGEFTAELVSQWKARLGGRRAKPCHLCAPVAASQLIVRADSALSAHSSRAHPNELPVGPIAGRVIAETFPNLIILATLSHRSGSCGGICGQSESSDLGTSGATSM